jgi:hypothetical protein
LKKSIKTIRKLKYEMVQPEIKTEMLIIKNG